MQDKKGMSLKRHPFLTGNRIGAYVTSKALTVEELVELIHKRHQRRRRRNAKLPSIRKNAKHVKSKTAQRFQARIAVYKAYAESMKQTCSIEGASNGL